MLLGNGLGGFSPAPGSPIAISGPFAVAVADFNLDGKMDLAVTNSATGSSPPSFFNLPPPASSVAVLLGNGSGGFTTAPGSPFSTGLSPDSIATGDFNGDGKPDLAVANVDSDNVTVLIGNGAGGFDPNLNTLYSAGKRPVSLISADLNGDGALDLALIPNDGYNRVVVLLGNGLGRFNAIPGGSFSTNQGGSFTGSTSPGGGPTAAIAADFNGDGRMDLVTANVTGSLTVFLGASAPTAVTLTAPGPSSTATTGQSVSLRAAVAAAPPYFNAPSGSVTFKDGGTTLGTMALSGGAASFDTGSLTAGVHSFTAVYTGNSRTALSTSTAAAVIVAAPPAPPITISGVANGASFQTGAAAPNAVLALFGSNLRCSPSPQVLVDGASVEVLGFNDTQINFVVPAGVGTGTIVLKVVCGANQSQAYLLPATQVAPAIFTAAVSGVGQGSILNQDGSVNGSGSPAGRGDIVSVYGTGFGPLGQPDADGLRRLVLPLAVLVASQASEVQFAGAAPGYTAGLQQVNVRIPGNTPSGSDVEIKMAVNGVGTQTGVTVAVK